jgi:hypothetical protein
MKTDEPRDDEILGRALSRAIETAEVNETPYDRSRIGARPLKRGTSFWRVAAVAASILVAGALGSTLLERPAADPSVGQQPTATVAPAHTQAATATPVSTPTPNATAIDRQVIYFARDQLPPVAVHVDVLPVGSGVRDINTLPTAAERIGARVHALIGASQAPSGTTNAMPPKTAVQSVSGVQIEDDLARVDLVVNAGNWQVSGAARSTAVLQQLVYTITEEPGIRRVLITQNGGKPTTIDQFAWTKPLSRDDVSGYAKADTQQITTESSGQSTACTVPCPSPGATRLSNTYSVDSVAPGVARFVVQVESGQLRDFNLRVEADNDAPPAWGSKAVLHLQVAGRDEKPGLEIIDRSPIRAINTSALAESTTYEVTLDDQRPWRVLVLNNPERIVVDFGGYPAAISDTVAVYSPKPGDTGRQFTVSGVSRTFEATTAWRVVDSTRKVLASGTTTASRGTSAVWGTYQVSLQLPASASGNVTLEVYWASPRDGADTGLVQVPLVAR